MIGSNPEYKKYILSESRSQFKENSSLSDEIVIRERIYDGESRILCYNAYGDPYPRSVRDVQRVWKMGAGYTKRGKAHQQFSKRDNKFNTHNIRNQMQQRIGQGKVRRLNRKPGEYDLPVFDKDAHSDDIEDNVRHQIEKQKELQQQENKDGGGGGDRKTDNKDISMPSSGSGFGIRTP